ncbi:MAG: Fpg/Nei family DNA glycosylase [Dehalococcoidia bacterium]|nr:Fpg/Nei family DNA glycosylase [Dehalococcoidia bacterium]
MPEIPDLENVKSFLEQHILGVAVQGAETPRGWVIRYPTALEFVRTLEGDAVQSIARRGKFLLFSLRSGHLLAINSMLTGRLQYREGQPKKVHKRTNFILHLADGHDLLYYDQKSMGKVYLVPADRLDLIPNFSKMGPDALEMSLLEFQERLRKRRGMVKPILTDAEFIAGIGNAYADEILWEARVHPHKNAASLSVEEVERLHSAIGSVLRWAIGIVGEEMRCDIDRKIRDFLRVHRKGGEPCPRCSHTISEIAVRERVTSFCRQCQPEVPQHHLGLRSGRAGGEASAAQTAS